MMEETNEKKTLTKVQKKRLRQKENLRLKRSLAKLTTVPAQSDVKTWKQKRNDEVREVELHFQGKTYLGIVQEMCATLIPNCEVPTSVAQGLIFFHSTYINIFDYVSKRYDKTYDNVSDVIARCDELKKCKDKNVFGAGIGFYPIDAARDEGFKELLKYFFHRKLATPQTTDEGKEEHLPQISSFFELYENEVMEVKDIPSDSSNVLMSLASVTEEVDEYENTMALNDEEEHENNHEEDDELFDSLDDANPQEEHHIEVMNSIDSLDEQPRYLQLKQHQNHQKEIDSAIVIQKNYRSFHDRKLFLQQRSARLTKMKQSIFIIMKWYQDSKVHRRYLKEKQRKYELKQLIRNYEFYCWNLMIEKEKQLIKERNAILLSIKAKIMTRKIQRRWKRFQTQKNMKSLQEVTIVNLSTQQEHEQEQEQEQEEVEQEEEQLQEHVQVQEKVQEEVQLLVQVEEQVQQLKKEEVTPSSCNTTTTILEMKQEILQKNQLQIDELKLKREQALRRKQQLYNPQKFAEEERQRILQEKREKRRVQLQQKQSSSLHKQIKQTYISFTEEDHHSDSSSVSSALSSASSSNSLAGHRSGSSSVASDGIKLRKQINFSHQSDNFSRTSNSSNSLNNSKNNKNKISKMKVDIHSKSFISTVFDISNKSFDCSNCYYCRLSKAI